MPTLALVQPRGRSKPSRRPAKASRTRDTLLAAIYSPSATGSYPETAGSASSTAGTRYRGRGRGRSIAAKPSQLRPSDLIRHRPRMRPRPIHLSPTQFRRKLNRISDMHPPEHPAHPCVFAEPRHRLTAGGFVVVLCTLANGCRAPSAPSSGVHRSSNVMIEWYENDEEGGQPIFITGTSLSGAITRFYIVEQGGATVSPDGNRCAIVGPPYCDHFLYLIDFSGEEPAVYKSLTSAHGWDYIRFDSSGSIRCTRWEGGELRFADAHPGHRVVYTLQDFEPIELDSVFTTWRRSPPSSTRSR